MLPERELLDRLHSDGFSELSCQVPGQLGLLLRDEGTRKVDMAESDLWKKAADRAIKHLASTGRLFSAEHVREMVGDPVHANAFGSRFLNAAKKGVIERVGYVQSSRPSLHAHPIALWRGAQQGGC